MGNTNFTLEKINIEVYKYFLLCIFLDILIFAANFTLISDNLYFNTFSGSFEYDRIILLLEQAKKWEWTTYVLFPILIFIKLSLITFCLAIAYYLQCNRFKFNLFFNTLLNSELIFLVPILCKIVWFLFIQTDYDFNDLQRFYPLSVLNLFNTESLPKYWLYPLQLLNLFEVAYWFLLAHGVADATGFSLRRSFGLVMSSYGVGLVLWVVLVMFLTITYS